MENNADEHDEIAMLDTLAQNFKRL